MVEGGSSCRGEFEVGYRVTAAARDGRGVFFLAPAHSLPFFCSCLVLVLVLAHQAGGVRLRDRWTASAQGMTVSMQGAGSGWNWGGA